MNWKFADLSLNGHEYTVSECDGDFFVAVHFDRYMPGSVRTIRTSKRIHTDGKMGQFLIGLAQTKWAARKEI